MRILGIDFGDRSIGLALSDRMLLTAQALGRYRLKSKEEDRKYFEDLVLRHEVGEIVIGLPLRMDGSPGSRVEKTKNFGRWLENTLRLPIVFWDERLTTRQALRILSQEKMHFRRRKALKDQVSATLILSSYLESRRGERHDPQSH